MKGRRLTPEVLSEIAKYHGEGMTVKESCQLVGANPRTVYNYISEGRKQKSGKKRNFFLEMEKSNASFIKMVKERMIDSGSPKALEYLLRVTDPDTYNISNKTEFKGNVKSDVTLSSKFSKQSIENFIDDSEIVDDIEEDLNKLDKNANKG